MQWEQMQQNSGQISQCNTGNFILQFAYTDIIIVVIVKKICVVCDHKVTVAGSWISSENRNTFSCFLNVLKIIVCGSLLTVIFVAFAIACTVLL